MLYVRYTEPVSLLEISEDYMKMAEEFRLSFDDFLRRIPYVWGPFRLVVEGETRSGGFSSSAVIVPVLYSDSEWISGDDFSDISGIVKDIARKKTIGYLRFDGVVKHLSEPYKRLFVKVWVPRLGAEFVIEWYKRRTAKVYNASKRVVNEVIKLLIRDPWVLKPTKDVATLFISDERVRVGHGESVCRRWIKAGYGCDCDIGYLARIPGRRDDVYALVVGKLPYPELGKPCRCKVERYKTKNGKEYEDVSYLYVPDLLCEKLRKWGG